MNLKNPKFPIGTTVCIVNYGHIVYDFNDEQQMESKDISPYLIGQIGQVAEISTSGYAVSGINGKYAWYNEDQLERVVKGSITVTIEDNKYSYATNKLEVILAILNVPNCPIGSRADMTNFIQGVINSIKTEENADKQE